VTEGVIVAIVGVGVAAVGGAGTALGAWLAGRATRKAAEATAGATVKASEDSAQDKLIDQLQEELVRYRSENDKRVERLEREVRVLHEENRGYRAFIGVQRDHMALHNVPLPEWPEGLPR
jgi:Zn-dependent alcohol dehydrogenase